MTIDDVERNDEAAALRYLREWAADTGYVLGEELGMLAMMQDDFPESIDRLVDAMEADGIEVRGEFM